MGSGQVVAHGPILDLLPEDCTFGDAAAELSFDLRPLLGGYQGEALFCVLRQDPTVHRNGHAFRSLATFPLNSFGAFEQEGSSEWFPLTSKEGIALSEGGLATIEVRAFGRIMVTTHRLLLSERFGCAPTAISVSQN